MKKFFSISVVFFALMANAPSFAANYTSNANGDWSLSTTWTPVGVPTFNDVVVIQHAVTLAPGSYSGSGSVTIQTGGTLTVSGNLTLTANGTKMIVSSGGSLSVSGALQVNNQALLTLSGGSIAATGAMTLGAGTYNATSGTASFLSFTTTNSGNTHFTNSLGATLTLTGTAVTGNFVSNTTFSNSGTITMPGSFTQAGSGTFTNDGQMSVGSNFTANGKVDLKPGTTANSKLTVGGNLSVASGNTFTVGTAVVPGFYADLIVYQNFSLTSGTVNVARNGRVGIFGDLSLSGGGNQFNVGNGGQVYVDGDGTGHDINLTAGGNNVNNNNPTATPQFGLYVNGTTAAPGGGSGVDADRADEVSMQANNPTFYAFLASQPNNPLPVVLLSFDVSEVDKQGITIEWVSTMEKDLEYFQVERAGSDLQFIPAGKINSSGGWSVKTSYQFVDRSPISGKSYYRLKMVDLDGKFEYSKLVFANWSFDGGIKLYPNPVINGKFTITLNDRMDPPTQFQVSDHLGNIVYQFELSQGASEVQLPDTIKPGLYFVRIFMAHEQEIIRFFVQ